MHGMTFEQFIGGFGFEYFSASELLYKGQSHDNPDSEAFGLNTDPPPDLWWNIIPTVRVLDMARATLGQPVQLTNIYRAPLYNDAVGGAVRSQHPQFTAVDCTAEKLILPRLYHILWRLREDGIYSGGLHYYEDKNFIHIDTRGVNKDW